MGWLKRIALGLGVVLVLIVMALAGLIVSDRLAQPPSPDARTLLAQAARYHARIRRDDFGVPHITGATDADVAYGLAYAHAEDDFATIQEVTLATRGSLAAEQGFKAAPTDYVVRLLRVWPTVNARYERDLPDDLKRVLTAYAAGINAYGARHPDKVAPGLLPVSGRDIAAG